MLKKQLKKLLKGSIIRPDLIGDTLVSHSLQYLQDLVRLAPRSRDVCSLVLVSCLHGCHLGSGPLERLEGMLAGLSTHACQDNSFLFWRLLALIICQSGWSRALPRSVDDALRLFRQQAGIGCSAVYTLARSSFLAQSYALARGFFSELSIQRLTPDFGSWIAAMRRLAHAEEHAAEPAGLMSRLDAAVVGFQALSIAKTPLTFHLEFLRLRRLVVSTCVSLRLTALAANPPDAGAPSPYLHAAESLSSLVHGFSQLRASTPGLDDDSVRDIMSVCVALEYFQKALIDGTTAVSYLGAALHSPLLLPQATPFAAWFEQLADADHQQPLFVSLSRFLATPFPYPKHFFRVVSL